MKDQTNERDEAMEAATVDVTPADCADEAAEAVGHIATIETAGEIAPDAGAESAAPQHESEHAGTGERDIEQLIADAEQRGYLRGRNEEIARRLKEPGLWEMAEPMTDSSPDDREDTDVDFLSHLRPNVWDSF